jgi:hypothetical protein
LRVIDCELRYLGGDKPIGAAPHGPVIEDD